MDLEQRVTTAPGVLDDHQNRWAFSAAAFAVNYRFGAPCVAIGSLAGVGSWLVAAGAPMAALSGGHRVSSIRYRAKMLSVAFYRLYPNRKLRNLQTKD